MAKGVRDLMVTQREQAADKYEKSLLNEGIDVRVTLGGVHKDQLTIKYVLLNRAWAYKITNGGDTSAGSFLGNWEKIGSRSPTASANRTTTT